MCHKFNTKPLLTKPSNNMPREHRSRSSDRHGLSRKSSKDYIKERSSPHRNLSSGSYQKGSYDSKKGKKPSTSDKERKVDRNKKFRDKEKKHKRHGHSTSSSESSSDSDTDNSSASSKDSLKLLEKLTEERRRLAEEKRRRKELIKATESAEEKRLRR